jgi:hypothetical protein
MKRNVKYATVERTRSIYRIFWLPLVIAKDPSNIFMYSASKNGSLIK